MSKTRFIRVTETGYYGWPMLVNISNISMVRRAPSSDEGNAVIYLDSGQFSTVETVEEITRKIIE